MTCNDTTCIVRPGKIEDCKFWNGKKCKLKKVECEETLCIRFRKNCKFWNYELAECDGPAE